MPSTLRWRPRPCSIVVEPMNTGLAGDLFAVIYVAKENKLYTLNASGMAASGRHARPFQRARLSRRRREFRARLRHAELRHLAGYSAGRCLGLGGGAQALREAEFRGGADARHRLRRERLPNLAAHRS